MTNVLYLDLESFYQSGKDGLSLRSSTYSQYANDPRFQVICLAYAWNDGPVVCIPGPQVREFLNSVDWTNTIACSHNWLFDGSVLHQHYGVYPAHVMCTMSMAATAGLRMAQGGSLGALAEVLSSLGHNIKPKGDEVIRADGKHYEDFSPAELHAYMEYCRDDVDTCRSIAYILLDMLPSEEVAYQSMMLKCGSQPRLLLDKPLLEQELERIKIQKAATLDEAAAKHGCTPLQFKTVLMSNIKFGALLEEYGCEVPMKVSKATGKPAPALAKSDEGMQLLADHDDPRIQTFVAARLGNKTTTEETKIERLIEAVDHGALPMSYLISGAHTHRLSATQKINVMALSSGRVPGTTNAARRAIMAPPGHVVVAVDSGAVEVRTGGYICNDNLLLDAFRQKRDIYIDMAASMFGRQYDDLKAERKAGDKDAELKRQIGKTTILGCSYGSGKIGFQTYARTMAKLKLSEDEADAYVKAFRSKYHLFPEMWRTCDSVLHAMMERKSGTFGGPDGKLFKFDGGREEFGLWLPSIQLPDGVWMAYLNLREEEAPKVPEGEYQRRTQIVYDTVKGRNKVPTKTYSSKIFENINQALAFAALKYQMLLIDKRYPIVGNVHDEGLFIAPEAEAEEAKAFALECFSTVPPWLGDCPLVGEAGAARRYGET